MATRYSTLYVRNNGIGQENLNPQFTIYKDIVTGNNVTPVPSIDEIGSGLYRIVDPNIDFGSRVTGLIDAGNTVSNQSERFIPYAIDFIDDGSNTEVKVASVIDVPNTAILFTCFIQNNGIIKQDGLTSVSVDFYDSNHNLLFVSSSTTQQNGVFIFSESIVSITLVANRPYYQIATMTLDTGETFVSGEVSVTLN